MIGMTHAMTGPIAASRSERQGCENQIAERRPGDGRARGRANRSVGRIPNAARSRRTKPPHGDSVAADR